MNPTGEFLGGNPMPQYLPELAKGNQQTLRTCIIANTCTQIEQTFLPLYQQGTPISTMPVTKGQEGYVLGEGYLDNTNTRWMQFALARSTSRGWVRERDLTKGVVAGKVKVKDTRVHLQICELPAEFHSVLEKTVSLLYSEITANRDNLVEIGANVFVLDDLKLHMNRTIWAFLHGIPKDLRPILRDGSFTFDQLWNLPDTPMNWLKRHYDRRAGIYAILFRDIDGVQGNNGIYIGKSVDLGERQAKHRFSLRTHAKGYMYQTGSSASAIKIMLLCDLSDVPIGVRHSLLAIGEHTGVSLFQSWAPVLLTEDFTLSGLADKYYFDSHIAKAYNALANTTFSRSSWNVPAGVTGLNWQTPLTELILRHTSFTCQAFTPNDETGPIRVYRGAAKSIHKGGANAKRTKTEAGVGVMLICGGADGRGRIFITLDFDKDDVPSQVFVVVEIYTGPGKRHPVPWARLPEPGPFTSWSDLNRIGIRYEWQRKDGQWVSAWCQATNGPFRDINFDSELTKNWSDSELEASRHVSRQYLKIRCLYDTLMQIEYTDAVPPWMKRGPQIEVKEISYDHLKQTVTIKDQVPTRRLAPKLLSFNQNFVALQDTYGMNLYFKPIAGTMRSHIDKVPVHCAMCDIQDGEVPGWFMMDPADWKNPCPNPDLQHNVIPGLSTCKRCYKLRRPCVWIAYTDLYKPQNPPWRYKFIRVPAKYMGDKWVIAGPSAAGELKNGPVEEEIEESEQLMANVVMEAEEED